MRGMGGGGNEVAHDCWQHDGHRVLPRKDSRGGHEEGETHIIDLHSELAEGFELSCRPGGRMLSTSRPSRSFRALLEGNVQLPGHASASTGM